jgi:hypothetical protein
MKNLLNRLKKIYLWGFGNGEVSRKLFLFPNYFKKIGGGLIIVSILFRFTPSLHILNESCRMFFGEFLILGLFFIAISKDKVEDEMSFTFRLNAITRSFSGAVIFFVLRHFQFLIKYGADRDLNAQEVLFLILGSYIFLYFTYKLEQNEKPL